MMRSLIVVLAAVLATFSAQARDPFDAWRGAETARLASSGETIDIMRPELGRGDERPQKPRQRRRGSSNPVYPTPLPQPDRFTPTPPVSAQPSLPTVQPYVVSPQTGRALPNLDQRRPETGQDRALRCAHQAGVYGETGGSYLGSCINQ